MMQAKELMIGDWVKQKHSGLLLKVCAIDPPYIMAEGEDGQFQEDTLEPVRLTSEILEKNGFYAERNVGYVYEDGDGHEVVFDSFNSKLRILYNRDVVLDIEEWEFPVYKLQHALGLFGVDKVIKLEKII